MKYAEIKIMICLNREGMLSNKDISHRTKLPGVTVSRTLDSLEKQGLISGYKEKKYRTHSSLTRHGEQIAEVYKKIWRYNGNK
jgi:DNA-binding MarR family transcriptional regulator